MSKGKELRDLYNSVKNKEYNEIAKEYCENIISGLFVVARTGKDSLILDSKKFGMLYSSPTAFENILRELLAREDINLKYEPGYQDEYYYVTF